MNTYNELKMLYGAYFGVNEIDEYKTKEFVLQNIQKQIDKFISKNLITEFEKIKAEAYKQDLIVKLQDSLYILKDMNASYELILLIKNKIFELKTKKD